MPLRVIVTAEEIYRARRDNFAEHYEKSTLAGTYAPEVRDRVIRACALLPEPRLNMFASLDDWNYTAARVISHQKVQTALDIAQVPLDLLVRWYWSKSYWDEFMEKFKSLPIIEFPQYQMLWKGGNDGIVELVPLSIALNPSSYIKRRKNNPALKHSKIHTDLSRNPEDQE